MTEFIRGIRMPVRTVWMPTSMRISSISAGNFGRTRPGQSTSAGMPAAGWSVRLCRWTPIGPPVGASSGRVVEPSRAEAAERLDEMLRKAYEVLERRHITVSNGRVIYHKDKPLEDDGPTLMAIKTVLAIEDQRARLFGFNVPVKQQIGGDVTVTYLFEGVDLEGLK